MRLHLVDGSLPPAPKDASFTILLYSIDDAQVRSFVADTDNGWVDVSADVLARDDDTPRLVPVRRVETPLVNFGLDVYVGHRAGTS